MVSKEYDISVPFETATDSSQRKWLPPLTASMHSLAGLVTKDSMDHGGLIKVVKEEISLVGCGHGLGRRGH